MNDIADHLSANGYKKCHVALATAVIIFCLFALVISVLPSRSLAADITKNISVSESENLLDTIFGPPDNCLPKKPFYYDVRAKQSRYGDELGILEKLGAVGIQMKDFPEFYVFNIHLKFRGIKVIAIELPTNFGGYALFFSENENINDIIKNNSTINYKIKLLKNHKFNNIKSAKANIRKFPDYLKPSLPQFKNTIIVYSCPNVETEGN